MIFSTSFPMFIDSLKSIRLYNWARKKNHRHINTNRVCSLKKWKCLVFCYDNPTTIDLIWLCCLFMLIFFENRRTINKASQFQKCHKNWFPTLKKAMSGKNFFNQLKNKQNSQTTQLFECCKSLLTNCFSSRFFVKTHCTYTYIHTTVIVVHNHIYA